MKESWAEKLLGDVITLQRGFDLPERERALGTVPIVSSSGITGYHSTAKVRAPGVVTGRYGTLGEVFYIVADFWPLNTTLWVKDFKDNDPHYVSYLLRTLNLGHQNAAGAVPGVNRNALHMLSVRVPPRRVQEKIAYVLSAYDDLIENNIRRIKILEQMAQMLYREWFVDFRFPGHEKVKVVESEGGRVPKGWESGILRDVCKSIDYGYTASAVKEAVGPKFLRITDIVPDSIDWESVPFCAPPEKRIENYLLGEGDIVVARTGATTGYAKRLHKRHPVSIFASYLVRLKIGEEHSNAAFGLLLESDDYKRFIKANIGGAAQPQANAQVLTSIPVVIPPQKLQSDFSSIVEPLLDEKEILQLKNLNLRRTRDLLLPKLISGEISIKGAQTETAVQVV